MNLLIVEDDARLAAMIAKAFTEGGFVCTLAADGAEGFPVCAAEASTPS